MTDDRNFDRMARAWLEPGPNEAPDRAVSAVLQAVARTPQVRPLSQRLPWRSPIMNRLPIVATLVAALVIVVGASLWVTQQPATGGPTPAPASSTSPTPTASAVAVLSPAPFAAQVPAALRYTWIGQPRAIAGMPASDRFRFVVGPSSLSFPNDGLSAAVLKSDVAAPEPGRLQLVSTDSSAGCTPGDTGTYRWTLSPGGSRLTVDVDQDACHVRAEALAGDWIRVACIDPLGGCFGNLEAGTYPSQYIGPKLGVGENWTPNFGALSYTVPDGWANAGDFPSTFRRL